MSLWDEIEALTDEADWPELIEHRLHLIAARRRRDGQNGRIPDAVVKAEEVARIRLVGSQYLLERARAAYDGPIVVFKGPEVAARYPDPLLRTFADVDVLVPDVEGAHAALLGAGFVEGDDPPWAFRRTSRDGLFADRHHSRPLYWPGMPLTVELHRRPNWPRWLTPPPQREIFDGAVASRLGVDGLDAPTPEHHAIILAAHSWAHEPLSSVRELVDLLLVAEGLDRGELQRVADSWGVGKLCRTTLAVAESVVLGEPTTLAERLWARNLEDLRERTVFENHLEGWLSCYWTMPLGAAVRRSVRNVAWDFRPAVDESWGDKLRRIARAGRNAFVRKSAHDARLGLEAKQFHPPTKWARRRKP